MLYFIVEMLTDLEINCPTFTKFNRTLWINFVHKFSTQLRLIDFIRILTADIVVQVGTMLDDVIVFSFFIQELVKSLFAKASIIQIFLEVSCDLLL